MSNRTKIKIVLVAVIVFLMLIWTVPTSNECKVVGYTSHGHSVCEDDLND